ncbi:hypothetical protein ACFL54_03095 [Planctomycetota bacterium]
MFSEFLGKNVYSVEVKMFTTIGVKRLKGEKVKREKQKEYEGWASGNHINKDFRITL